MEKLKNTAAKTIRVGLSDEDARFIERQRKAVIDTRCEVFRCLRIVVLLNGDSDFLSESEKQLLAALSEKWGKMYAPQLLPKKMSLKERQAEVTEELTRQIEEIIGGYLPDCQLEVLGKLKERLPIKE